MSSSDFPRLVDFRPGMKAGWTRGGADDPLVIGNPNPRVNVQIRHVLLVNADGTPAYDQTMKLEKGGAVTLPFREDTGELGLVQVWRALVQPGDMATWFANFPNVSVESLGGLWHEAPRGFPELEDKTVADTADRETDAETGTAVVDKEFLGWVSGNSTFEAQLTAVYRATVDPSRVGRYAKDPNEKIVKVDWYSRRRIRELRMSGELVCGFTLAAIAALDLAHPGMFQ